MENQNQSLPPLAMPPHIKVKHNRIPLLIMIGVLLSLVLGALMMESVRNGEFALLSNPSNMASVSQLAQVTRTGDVVPPPPATAASPARLPPSTSGGSSTLLPPPATPTTGGAKTGANCTGNRCQFDNPLGQTGSLETFLNKLLDVVILIGSIAVVLSIIMAGLKYVTAQGDEGQIESAHKQLTWTVIGAAILLGAKVIAMVVQNTVKALS
jgi:hypothetical protein